MKTPVPDHDAKADASVYKTPDLYQAAYFLTKSVPFIGTERVEGRTFFLFRDEGKVKELIEQYFGNGPIPALSFKSSLRELKSLLHGGFGGDRT
jgi:hypothetical protein